MSKRELFFLITRRGKTCKTLGCTTCKKGHLWTKTLRRASFLWKMNKWDFRVFLWIKGVFDLRGLRSTDLYFWQPQSCFIFLV